MVAEIPGFDLPNRFSDLTTSLFSRDGICKLISLKINNLNLIIGQLLRLEPWT
jgi:hypothetical protein